MNDFRLGYVFIRNQTLNGDVGMIPGNPWPSGYGMPTGVTNPLYGGLPSITFSSFSGVLGANARTSSGGPQGDVDLVDTVSYLRGKHAFKFGFEYINLIYNHINYTNATGTVVFSTLQSYLQGLPNNGSISLGRSRDYRPVELVRSLRAGRLAHQAQGDAESGSTLRDLHAGERALQLYGQL